MIKPSISVQELVNFILQQGIYPSEVCEAMGRYYQQRVDHTPALKDLKLSNTSRRRFQDIKEACDQAAAILLQNHS